MKKSTIGPIGSISFADSIYQNPFFSSSSSHSLIHSKSSPDLLIFPSSSFSQYSKIPSSSSSFSLPPFIFPEPRCLQCQTNHWPKCSCCGKEMIGKRCTNQVVCYFYDFCDPCKGEYETLYEKE